MKMRQWLYEVVGRRGAAGSFDRRLKDEWWLSASDCVQKDLGISRVYVPSLVVSIADGRYLALGVYADR